MIDKVVSKDAIVSEDKLPEDTSSAQILPLCAEDVSVSRRKVEKAVV